MGEFKNMNPDEFDVWKLAYVISLKDGLGPRGAEQYAEQAVRSFQDPTPYRKRKYGSVVGSERPPAPPTGQEDITIRTAVENLLKRYQQKQEEYQKIADNYLSAGPEGAVYAYKFTVQEQSAAQVVEHLKHVLRIEQG